MSDMTPEQAAAELASGFPTRTPEYILERAIHAMKTIASMTKEYRAVSKHPDSILGPGSTIRTRWYPTRDEAIANRDPRIVETHSQLIGIEHRYVTQPEVSDD